MDNTVPLLICPCGDIDQVGGYSGGFGAAGESAGGEVDDEQGGPSAN